MVPLLGADSAIQLRSRVTVLDPWNQQPKQLHPSVQSNSSNTPSTSFGLQHHLELAKTERERHTYIEFVVFEFDGGDFEAKGRTDVFQCF